MFLGSQMSKTNRVLDGTTKTPKPPDSRRRAGASAKPRSSVTSIDHPARSAWWMNRWLVALLLLSLTLVLYGRLRNDPFINFDDDDYVLNNPHVQAGLTWQTLRWSLTAVTADNWHPLTWLSHAADCQLFGLDPHGPHTINLLLHALNAFLLFLLLDAATGKRGRSFIVAALFAWHPLNVESVAWIAERKNLLSTFLLLLTPLAYGWYARRPGWRRYSVVAVVFALGLAAKSMLVTLPVVLLLLDVWPLRRVQGMQAVTAQTLKGAKTDARRENVFRPESTWRRLSIEKLPLLALSLGAGIVTIVAQRAAGTLPTLQNVSLVTRLETAASAFALYIVKAVWPFGLAVYYPNPFDDTIHAVRSAADYLPVALGIVLLLLVSWLAWCRRRTHPYLFTGWFWYVITLLPVVGIVQVGSQAMADRYAYVPLIGLFVLGVWGLADASAILHLDRRLVACVAGVVLAGLCLATYRQISYWHSSNELWQHARAVTSDNYVAADKIAILLLQQRNPAAFSYYEEAARIAPWDPVSNEAVAALRASQGRWREAIQSYGVVIRGSKDPAVIALAYSNVGMIYTMLGNYTDAHDAAEEAVQRDRGRIEAEIREMVASLQAAPDAEGYFHLAMLLEQVGQLDAARVAIRKSLDLSPNSADSQRFQQHLR